MDLHGHFVKGTTPLLQGCLPFAQSLIQCVQQCGAPSYYYYYQFFVLLQKFVHTSVQREVSLFCHFLYNSCHIGFPVFKQASKQTCLSPIICGIFLGIYLNPLKPKEIEEEAPTHISSCTCSRIKYSTQAPKQIVCHLDRLSSLSLSPWIC